MSVFNRPWVVLVAGEARVSRISKYPQCLGAHTSMESIGQAYSSFRKFVPRERIIVIAQLKVSELYSFMCEFID